MGWDLSLSNNSSLDFKCFQSSLLRRRSEHSLFLLFQQNRFLHYSEAPGAPPGIEEQVQGGQLDEVRVVQHEQVNWEKIEVQKVHGLERLIRSWEMKVTAAIGRF